MFIIIYNCFSVNGKPILISIFINLISGLLITETKNNIKKYIFIVTVIADVIMLVSMKYIILTEKSIIIPLGASFITFREISYLTDIYYNKEIIKQHPLTDFVYLSMPSQVQSGPIVKYSDFSGFYLYKDHYSHSEYLHNVIIGFQRIMTGIIKKIIIADTFSVVTNNIFNRDPNSLSVLAAWIGAICYSLQLYYDFSGYSDIAIGFTRILGYDCKENFNHPYRSASFSEFWRKWHISLGEWFKHYVYFPLGGSHCSKNRTIFNLFVVWIITGLWHGFNPTFIIWGMIHFIFVTFEHITHINKSTNKYIKLSWRLITIFVVILAWIIFRSDTVEYGGLYIRSMFITNHIHSENTVNLIRTYWWLVAISIIFSVIDISEIKKHLRNPKQKNVYENVISVITGLLFIFSLALYLSRANNTFAYANF